MANVLKDIEKLSVWLADYLSHGCVAQLHVMHDDWCPAITRGAEHCICRPTYRMIDVSQ